MRWLADCTDEAIRGAVAELVPELADEGIEHVARTPDLREAWFRGTARIGRGHVAKFAWSPVTAGRILHEANVIRVLHGRGLPVPAVVHEPTDLACFVSRYVDGPPFDPFTVPTGDLLDAWADELARFMIRLHGTEVDVDVDVPRPEFWVQATTDQLREDEFLRMVDPSPRSLVLRWCDWCDDVLADEIPRVLVHGDLHGFNMRWQPDSAELVLVADFEMSGLADPAIDFRYQTTNALTNDLVLTVLDRYRAHGGTVSTERVAAWTILSVLGDARWRTLDGVELPGGGTPRAWVDDLASRLPELGAPGR